MAERWTKEMNDFVGQITHASLNARLPKVSKERQDQIVAAIFDRPHVAAIVARRFMDMNNG